MGLDPIISSTFWYSDFSSSRSLLRARESITSSGSLGHPLVTQAWGFTNFYSLGISFPTLLLFNPLFQLFPRTPRGGMALLLTMVIVLRRVLVLNWLRPTPNSETKSIDFKRFEEGKILIHNIVNIIRYFTLVSLSMVIRFPIPTRTSSCQN